MKGRNLYELGFGFCKGDRYQRPIERDGKYYCPECGERMRKYARDPNLINQMDSRPKE